MKNIDKAIVLTLNRTWRAIGQRTVRQAFCDLLSGTALAMDIRYELDENGVVQATGPIDCVPVNWEEWLGLPVRSCDLAIQTPRRKVRVPTVIVVANYAGMPLWRPGVTRRSIYERDGGICQYTGRRVAWSDGNLDHVVPRSRGGANSFENLVWSDRGVNTRKADRLPEEAGLRLLREPRAPVAQPIFRRIRNPKHADWRWFLKY
ncbi:HNH endonuclease [Pelagicoccus sp. SDUM812002]|uniref:HNH endonuclease n=1 Tax=Pelagicoccus sp. SDUM812002 TaxID=3041266 RepID=UPI00280EEAC9|nr:HNH endonuclease [Pelagicoccus sp. SDUM812002]MDQ8187149.1 HNH endonuclease [Pelagicoccus sp. SDUM812002]